MSMWPTKTNKVFLVSSGEYSEYTINAVFSTQSKAKECIDLVSKQTNHKFNNIEEYEIDPITIDLIKKGYKVYCIKMKKDGNVVGIRISDEPNFSNYFDKICHDEMFATVIAKDETHAVKITNEKRVEWIANNYL